jgi:putative ATPase
VNQVIKESGSLPVPLHIRNAPTGLMKELAYGKGYKYAHNYKNAYAPQDYLPDEIKGQEFYSPTDRGYERTIKQRLEKWRDLKEKGRGRAG